MASIQQLSTLSAALLVVGIGSGAFAQMPRAGWTGSPMYDSKSEVTIAGTVERVETITGTLSRGRGAMGGTHLIVKTATETLDVHVGPTAYLTQQKVVLAKGDTLEILGSRVTMGDKAVLLAREISKGTEKWTLRDESGRPLWSGPRR
jgi:hypothetical protein